MKSKNEKSFGKIVKRVLAYLIDYGIFMLFFVPIAVAVGGVDDTGNPYHQWINVLLLLVMWIILSLLESSNERATLGKRALGLRVVDLDGKRISFTTALIRNFIKILLWGLPKYLFPEYFSELCFWMGFLAIGQIGMFCVAIFSSKNQTVYDMVEKTVVVK